jgi:hypothetical protein
LALGRRRDVRRLGFFARSALHLASGARAVRSVRAGLVAGRLRGRDRNRSGRLPGAVEDAGGADENVTSGGLQDLLENAERLAIILSTNVHGIDRVQVVPRDVF